MITKEQVQHIANLAHIQLQEQEVERFQKDFASILEYFEILNEVDVAGIDPMTHSGTEEKKGRPAYWRGREDKPRRETEERRGKLLSLFPLVKGKFLQVPQVPWQSGKSTNNS
ncbi:MAG: Asp-tRNA(Asn)/Glu-tRNA(Gln) amidotransferase subunit GatC [Parcubacteria group bacterium]|nr:Asp-tRNA(Asn)/Glu-tRNA(Gln) amidotransferase subunit GatC [Parcubacteria group bacterium]